MTLEAIPADGSDESPTWRRRIGVMVNKLLVGGGDNVGTVEMSAGTTSTTISDTRIGPTTKIILVPESAGAAAQVYNGITFAKAIQNAVGVITHSSLASNVTVGYVITGS